MGAKSSLGLDLRIFNTVEEFVKEFSGWNKFDIRNIIDSNYDYKIAVVNCHISDEERSILLDLSKSFNERDFKVQILDGVLVFFVRRMNFERIYEIVAKSNLLTSIFNLLANRLGSYTIEGQYRVYKDFNSEKKVKERKHKTNKRGRIFYAKEFSKIENPFPSEYTNKIICGDSENILKKFPDNSVDLIFTSPPYNFGLDYEVVDDAVYWENYFDKLFRIFKECIRILKFGGRIVINIQPLFSDYIPTHHIISDFFRREGLIWRNEIIWEKNNYNCKYTAWGSWKSPSSPYLKYTWEFIEVFSKGSIKKFGKKENADISEEEFKKWTVAKWSIAPEKDMKKYGHPAMFPEELAYRVIKLFSFRGDLVLDPFNGAGTTTLVAKRLGRRYVGIDISSEYCEVAERRLKDEL